MRTSTRTDVYSLGVVLCQLLSGRLPVAFEELRSSGYEQLRQKLRESEPSRPSTKLSDGLAWTAPLS